MSVNYPAGTGRKAADLELAVCPDEKAVRKVARHEHAEQVTLFDQINAAVRQGRPGADMIFAVPNGTAAGAKVGAEMVREGVRKGVPDIVIAVPRFVAVTDGHVVHCCGAFVELKREQGVPSNVSAEQRDWLERLGAAGYKTCVCFGWREAWKFIQFYLGWEDTF